MSKIKKTTKKGSPTLKSAAQLKTAKNLNREVKVYVNPKKGLLQTRPFPTPKGWAEKVERSGFYEVIIYLYDEEEGGERSFHVQAYKPMGGENLMSEGGNPVGFASRMGWWASKNGPHIFHLFKRDAVLSGLSNEYVTPPNKKINLLMRKLLGQYA